MSKEGWELPIIINQSLKKKLQSASTPQLKSIQLPPKKKKQKPKDPYACIHKIPYRNVFQQSIPVSSLIKALSSITNTYTTLPSVKKSKMRRRKKSKIFTTPIPVTKPQGIMVTSFNQIENYLQKYFQDQDSQYLKEEVFQLKTLTSSGPNYLRENLDDLRHRQKVFLDPFVNLLFHSISAQIIRAQSFSDSIYHLERAEYYALRCKLLKFASYCLAEQASIFREENDVEMALSCLKKGLIISVHANQQEIIHDMLQKMGIFYYYSGNTAVGGYYHRLAEKGLTQQQAQVYKVEMRVQRYTSALQVKLFGIKKNPLSQTQKADLNPRKEDIFQIGKQEMERQATEHKAMVSKMLKDGGLRKIGQKLQHHMSETMGLASVIPRQSSPSPSQKSVQSLPKINVSHVLKSHLSKNREVNSLGRDWQLFRLTQLIDSLPE